MSDNKEIKIAILVGTIMITICILAFIFSNAKTPTKENIDLKVYKLYVIDEESKQYEYRECSSSTDDILTINTEFRKINKLDDSKKVKGQIKGNYKIKSKDSYIAFDGEEKNYIYRSDNNNLYEYNSSLYDYVKKICE